MYKKNCIPCWKSRGWNNHLLGLSFFLHTWSWLLYLISRRLLWKQSSTIYLVALQCISFPFDLDFLSAWNGQSWAESLHKVNASAMFLRLFLLIVLLVKVSLCKNPAVSIGYSCRIVLQNRSCLRTFSPILPNGIYIALYVRTLWKTGR